MMDSMIVGILLKKTVELEINFESDRLEHAWFKSVTKTGLDEVKETLRKGH